MSDSYVGDNKWIPKEEGDIMAEKIVWSTKQVDDLMVAMDQGFYVKVILYLNILMMK